MFREPGKNHTLYSLHMSINQKCTYEQIYVINYCKAILRIPSQMSSVCAVCQSFSSLSNKYIKLLAICITSLNVAS